MFAIKGWTPVFEVCNTVYKYVSDYHTRDFLEENKPESATEVANAFAYFNYINQSETAQIAWDFLDTCDDIAILSSAGNLVFSSRKLLSWHDPSSLKGIHVDISVGTVGTGHGYLNDDGVSEFSETGEHFVSENSLDEHSLRRRFGAFLYQPVLIREAAFVELCNRIGSDRPIPANAHADIAQKIVDRFDSGAPITKKWAKANYAPDMKATEFQATWDMATTRRPALSKPGPRTFSSP
ncbi:MAG: hypothetical protein IIX61_07795 [Loktanella sp.]|nr:hypothetical protein [Loktanella sp.]